MHRRSERVSSHRNEDSPRPARRRAGLRWGGALLVSTLAVAGCAAPVAVEVPGDAVDACVQAAELLPTTVRGQERRETTPPSDLTAAWGDPPVVWRCGVGSPAALRPDSSLIEINGISWFAEELTGGYRFTTIGLQPDVELTVPKNYAPEAEVVVRLTPALEPLRSAQ